MKKPLRGIVVLLGLCLLAAASAQAGDRFKVRASLAWGYSTSEAITSDQATMPVVFADANDGVGFGAAFEFRATSHLLGIEVGALSTSMDMAVGEITLTPGGFDIAEAPFEIDVEPVFLGANFHLMPKDNMVDVFLGPFYTRVGYSDQTFTVGSEPAVFSAEDDNALGFNVGFDIHLGKMWFVGGGLRYIDSSADFRIRFPEDMQESPPLTLRVRPIYHMRKLTFRCLLDLVESHVDPAYLERYVRGEVNPVVPSDDPTESGFFLTLESG